MYITKQVHRYREQTSSYQWGEERREGPDNGMELEDPNYYA